MANERTKRLPIKGLVGQEMALDEYLQYIQSDLFISRTSGQSANETELSQL